MRLLFDSDMLLFRVGFRYDNATEEEAIEALLSAIDWSNDIAKADIIEHYLSCPRDKSFRYALNNNYKANRTDRKPVHHAALRNYLITSLNAVVPENEEADDLIGIEQWQDEMNTICCTVDKDILYGVVGGKLNFMTGEMFHTSSDDATYFFYRQLLMGDTADNVKGIDKVGEVKSHKLLERYYGNEEELFAGVLSLYKVQYGDKAKEKLLQAGQMLKIRQWEGQIWELPFE